MCLVFEGRSSCQIYLTIRYGIIEIYFDLFGFFHVVCDKISIFAYLGMKCGYLSRAYLHAWNKRNNNIKTKIMKKILSLLALVLMSCMGAWAETREVSSLYVTTDVQHPATYRMWLKDGDNNTCIVTKNLEQKGYGTTTEEARFCFLSTGTNNEYYIYETINGKYVKATNSSDATKSATGLVDVADEACKWTIVASTTNARWLISPKGRGTYMNFYKGLGANQQAQTIGFWTDGNNDQGSRWAFDLIEDLRFEYAINFDNAAHSHSSGGRKVTQIMLGDQSIDINATGNFYQDLTATASFTIKTGQSVKPQIIWNGSWMAGYVYVDKDASDKQFTVEELVSSTAGEGTHNFTTDLPAFTIETSGDYRMRYKVDWNSTDPGGSATLKNDGGYILDVMLHVQNPEDVTYTLYVSGDITDGVEVVYNENTVVNGGTFIAPNNLGSNDLTVNGLPSYMVATVVIEGQDVYVKTHYAYYHALKRAETLEVGKKYMIYNACNNILQNGNNEDRTGFMYGAPNVTHDGVHTNPLTSKLGYEYLWVLEPSAGSNKTYYIRNVSTGKYAGSNGAASNNGVDLYIQPWATATINKGDNPSSYNSYHEIINGFDNVFAIANGENGGTCWNGNPAQFTTWANSHPWAFYEVCGVEDAINNDILEIARDYAAHKIAQNPAHSTKYGTFQEATTASTDALVAGTSTFDEYVAALNGVVAANVVAPAPNTFIRIKGVSDKYISGTAATKNVSSADRRVMTDNEDDAIFWYNLDGKLVGYKSGQGFASTCEVAAVGAEMDAQTFSGDATSASGTLTIMGNGSYFYDHNDVYGVVNRNGTNHQTNCDWTVTDVTSLPVALTQVGDLAYASFNAPVAVAVPSGVTAYGATINGNVLELTAFEGTNLAANTPVILTAETGATYNFDIVASGAACSSDLKGTVAKQNVAADKTTYVLNKKGDKIGFYTSVTFINGFKAYCETEAASNANALSFRFDDVLTAIEAIQSENSGAEVYDLQGRRLTKAQKGMNIINGHKVLVK